METKEQKSARVVAEGMNGLRRLFAAKNDECELAAPDVLYVPSKAAYEEGSGKKITVEFLTSRRVLHKTFKKSEERYVGYTEIAIVAWQGARVRLPESPTQDQVEDAWRKAIAEHPTSVFRLPNGRECPVCSKSLERCDEIVLIEGRGVLCKECHDRLKGDPK